jgi:hypothetical protein
VTDSHAQDRAADGLAGLLTAALVPVAQRAERVETTAATPEQVDLVIELEALGRMVAEHSRRVLMGEPVEWVDIAERLAAAARACRGQVVVDAPVLAGDE